MHSLPIFYTYIITAISILWFLLVAVAIVDLTGLSRRTAFLITCRFVKNIKCVITFFENSLNAMKLIALKLLR